MKIEHVAMYVKDLESAKTFFETYFEATSNDQYHNPKTGLRTYFLSFSDGARLELMTRPEMIEKETAAFLTGYTHLAFSLGSKEAVDTLTAHLAADGYQVLSGPRTTGDGYYESCILGPEENQIEITA
ncbi:VOC family protein [Enterococcus devriesei]|uniref:VOC family protein n=1 Tax=Enterococcus devriesei TaxID=319970 RepID=UPI0028AD2AA7|nr:VOC family protein [Enterococcus devriesei]